MTKFNCPSCGAEITFRSSITVSCVCEYCRSLVVRRDTDVEAIGKMAQLPQDISPFQIGTSGVYKGIAFTLIGRLRIGWEDGAWNEWFMFSDDGRKGWLAEAQGSLAISFEEDLPEGEAVATKGIRNEKIITLSDMPKLGISIIINHKTYSVVDIKESECIASEGELPFVSPQGRKTKSVDLLGSGGEFACIEYSENAKVKRFIGEYVEFDDLKFSNLRELTGWGSQRSKIPAAKGKKIDASW